MVAFFTMAGLVIAITYNNMAISNLSEFCSSKVTETDNHGSKHDCIVKIYEGKYDGLNMDAIYWVIMVLNIISVIFFCLS